MTESLTAKLPRMHSPVNRLTASVIRSGIHYEETFTPKSEVVSLEPLPTRPYPRNSNPSDNLTGLKVGRFTVIGMSATSSSWVVKCACGRYVYRKAKVLKAVTGLEGHLQVMCSRCGEIEKAKTAGKPDDHKKALHSASFPMYQAIQEILRCGLTVETRRMARVAISFAQSEDGAREQWLRLIAAKQIKEATNDSGQPED
jgi:hypothetical protein